MADINLSFSAEGGISLDDLVGIFAGPNDPSVLGEVAPLGSLFVRQNGQLFQKTGPNDVDWLRFSQGLGEAIKITSSDTTAGYLNSKLLVSASLVKTIGNAGANETLTIDLAPIGTAGTYTSVTVNTKGQVTAGTNPTTLAGYGITNGQPLDATLTSLAAYNTNGFLVQTATDTFAGRTITGTTNQISVNNGSGSGGNPTLSFPSTTLTFPGTAGVILPRGTTAQRVNTIAYTRYNNDLAALEYYNGTTWVSLVASTLGTVTNVAMVGPTQGVVVTGSPITTSGTFTLTLTNDLGAVEGLTTLGLAARTATDTWTTRAITGTTDRITVTNGDAIAGNPTLDIASTYVGQTSISTLGIVTTGNWQGTTIGTAYGGTGRTSIGAANTVLGVNTSATGLEYKAIASGTGISIAPSSQLITITNTGVTSITGTANQVITTAATGGVTLSLPQSINTTANPTFNSVTVAADPTQSLQLATKQYVDAHANGLTWIEPIFVNGLLSDSTTTPPVAAEHDSYIVPTGATGAWTGLAGHLVEYNGTAWVDMGLLSVGARLGISLESGSVPTDTFLGKANQVAVITGTNPYTYSFFAPSDGSAVLVNNPLSVDAYHQYVYNATSGSWFEFAGPITYTAGTGIGISANVVSILPTGVTPGTYNRVTVNAEGQVTTATNIAYLTGNQTIVLSGDVTGSGANAITTTLSNTGVTAGTYKSVTVDAKGRVAAGTNPTTLAGYGITDAQPLSTLLTSINAVAGDGILIKNGTTAITRSIAVASTKLSIVDAAGILGNPTLDVVEGNILINNLNGILGTGKGGTGLSALGGAGTLLGVNSTATGMSYKTLVAGSGISINQASDNITIACLNGGTVTSVGISGSTGLTVSGSPVTTAGTISLILGTELQALSGLSTLGVVTRTAAGTYTTRNIVSGGGTLAITNPSGTAGNISLDLSSAGTAGTYKSVTTDAFGRVTSGTNPTTLSGYGITDAVNVSQLGVANGVATLDSTGKLTLAQIPATAITDTFVVNSQVAMLALTSEVGDIAVRTDLNKTYILKALPATSLANWQELLTPTDAVTSVNGQTGIVSVGTVTSVGITSPAQGLSFTGSPITTSGNITATLANDLAAVEGLSTVGIAVRTAADTWATRTLVAGTGITLTNANGTAGDITISAAAGSVTSVGLSLPSIFSVTNSPVTSSGTLTGTLVAQAAKTFFAGPTTGSAAPTFRTVAIDEMSNVNVTSPTVGQVLAYDATSSKWINTGAVGSSASGLIGAGQTGAAAWTLSTGTRYYADFAHNLGTTSVVITVYDTNNNAVVIPDSTVLTSANNVRITVVGNTRTLRVVVVANGQAVVIGGSGGGGSLAIAKDGVTISPTTTTLNFSGQAVSVTDAGAGTTNVVFGARYSYFANSLDTPNNADFAINALAPVTTDPTYNSLNVRAFSNTVEQGVGFTCSIPAGATQVTFKFRGRPQTAPGAASVVQPRLYSRQIPNGSAVGTWSAASELANLAIPTTAFFQYAQQTVTLASLGLTADKLYQFELTRRIAGVTGTNLAANYLLVELTLEFT